MSNFFDSMPIWSILDPTKKRHIENRLPTPFYTHGTVNRIHLPPHPSMIQNHINSPKPDTIEKLYPEENNPNPNTAQLKRMGFWEMKRKAQHLANRKLTVTFSNQVQAKHTGATQHPNQTKTTNPKRQHRKKTRRPA